MPYIPSHYWSRLHSRSDSSAVGQTGLPSVMNDWLYEIQRRNLYAFLARNGATRIAGAAFDVGAGRGYWVDEWLKAGATSVDGCDLVPAAVDRLNARFSATGRFVVADIGLPRALSTREYALVSCMNVLLHLTDDRQFDQALTNLAKLVEPGGRLLLAEPILNRAAFERPFDPEVSSRARPLARYRDGLNAAGLLLEDVSPATAIASNPIESRTRAALFAWRAAWAACGLPSKIVPAAAHVVGPVLATLDPLLLGLGAGPSGKYALFARPVQ